MPKFARIVLFAALSLGLAAGATQAMTLGSASRIAGLSIAGASEAVSSGGLHAEAPLAAPTFSTRLYLTLALVNRIVDNRPVVRNELRAYWPAGLLPVEGEDAARAKRDRLVRHGLPADALRLEVRAEDGARRMVLVVETSAGDFVLDSRSRRVVKEVLDERRTASIAPVLPELRFR